VNCRYRATLWILLIFAIASSQIAVSGNSVKDLGTVGTTYPVIEADVVAELTEKANRQEKTHRPDPQLEQLKTHQPANLQKLPHAEQDRDFFVTMDYSLEHDFVDGEGKILYPKGFTFNPLDYVSFSAGLVVIDGRDPKQISWFQKTPYAANHRVRLLLSDGYAFELGRLLKRPVFYLTKDIATRLQLAVVPAVVVQHDRNLLVYEIAVPHERQENADEGM
jgi:conjugal transfer pilus assembly protein TraW